MSATAHATATAPPVDAGRLAMWVFIATEWLFFGGLLVAYLVGRVHSPQGFALASRHTDVLLGTLNTGLLLTSSALVALAVARAESHGGRRGSARLLWAAAALGLAFMAVKGLEWRHDWQENLFPGPGFVLAGTQGAELFFMLYFVATGLHALHLAIGIGVVGSFARGVGRGRPWATSSRLEIAALYWHFVDVVWIVLYPLIYLVERHS